MTDDSIAHRLAKKQKQISVAEFFERNKHVLGFDSPTKAVLTSIKEGVDNALDACEEAGILPDIYVELRKLKGDEFHLVIEDNGPGILKSQVPRIFGQLLYGSRFHAICQSRGQQGIGISAVVMYAQLTTGKHATIKSKVANEDTAYLVELMLDTKRNKPSIVKEDRVIWEGKEHGTRFEATIRGRLVKSKQSVYEYLRGTAIVNPHARIVFHETGKHEMVFERVSEKLPPKVSEIKPHPDGIELGTLLKMAKETKALRMSSFLSTEFSSVSTRKAKEICDAAHIDEKLRPKKMSLEETKALIDAFNTVKIRAPDNSCISPIGESLIKKGLKNVLGEMRPDFYAPPVTRVPRACNGNPFQVEVGIVYGGDLPKENPVEILRFANRVPLLYQQGACAITKGIEKIDWRRYGLDQRGGAGIPNGPAVILVHVASTKVPFTSESKEAIASLPVLTDEIERGLRDCARKLKIHLGKKKRRGKATEKFQIVQELLPLIAQKSAEILDKPMPDINKVMTKIMDIVWVEDSVEYAKKRHKVNIRISNYTKKAVKLGLFATAPLVNIDPKSYSVNPKETNEPDRLFWDLPRIPSAELLDVTFEVTGLKEDELDEVEFYVEGIDHSRLLGAGPLPGDWDIRGQDVKITTLEDFGEEAGEEEEESEDEEEEYEEEVLDDDIPSPKGKSVEEVE